MTPESVPLPQFPQNENGGQQQETNYGTFHYHQISNYVDDHGLYSFPYALIRSYFTNSDELRRTGILQDFEEEDNEVIPEDALSIINKLFFLLTACFGFASFVVLMADIFLYSDFP
jgi:hypothetical protein